MWRTKKVTRYALKIKQVIWKVQMMSFRRWAVSWKNLSDLRRCDVPSRLPDNEDPEVRKNFKLSSFIV